MRKNFCGADSGTFIDIVPLVAGEPGSVDSFIQFGGFNEDVDSM